MAEKILKLCCFVLTTLFVVRFAIPGFNGVSGRPFLQPWVNDASGVTPMLDADLRFFGAILFGLAVLLIWVSQDLPRRYHVLTIIASATFLAALLRTWSLITMGSPGLAGLLPLFGEFVVAPMVWISTYHYTKELRGQ